jgi:AcrR family transcriptional regulator
MRKLAEELGATPMAVYRYFPNKGALLDALVDRSLDGTELPAMRAAPWQERARQLASFYRARLLESPETVPWVLSRVGVSPGALRDYEAALSIVRESGLPDVDVVRVVDATVSYVMGFVAIEVARQGAGTKGRGYRSLVPQFLQLPSREFPMLVALAAHAGDFDDELFGFGLDLLLEGARARVPAAGERKRLRR